MIILAKGERAESGVLRLGDLLEEFDDRLGSRLEPEILTLTEKMGFVAQRERFKKRLALADTSRYKVIGLYDIAFNPYLLWANAIAQNTRWESAIISPLYPTFHVRMGYSQRFVNYLLCGGFLTDRYGAIARGSVPRKRRTTVDDFLALVVNMPVPSFDEQVRIVTLLDEANELRILRSKADRRTVALLPALFQAMFDNPRQEYSLKPFRDVLSEPLRNGLSPSKEGTFAGKVFTLAAITGASFDSTAWKGANFARLPDASCQATESLFLICRGNGNRALVGEGKFPIELEAPMVFPDTMIAAVPRPDIILPIYLEAVWHLPAIRSQIQSGARTTNGTFKINQTIVEEIRIPVPPLPLQNEFAEKVAEIRKLEASQAASRMRLDDLFQSLLHSAFAGEL